MTRDEFGSAYQCSFRSTVRFLMAKGLSADAAQETAQAAWARGWERLSQLRDSRTLVIWLNRVALNLYRSSLRGAPSFQELTRAEEGPELNIAAIDAASILRKCKAGDRRMLRDFYLKGLQLAEIAQRNGCHENTARVRLYRARQAARINLRLPPEHAR